MSEMMEMGLGWLFLSAFTSATLLPGSSEVLLGAMAAKPPSRKNRKIFKAVGNKKP